MKTICKQVWKLLPTHAEIKVLFHSAYVKVKWSHCRPVVAQRMGRGIALLFHDCSTRRGWVVSSTPQHHFTPGKDPVPILEEAGWAPGPVWTGRKSCPHHDSILDRPACSQSLYRLSHPPTVHMYYINNLVFILYFYLALKIILMLE